MKAYRCSPLWNHLLCLLSSFSFPPRYFLDLKYFQDVVSLETKFALIRVTLTPLEDRGFVLQHLVSGRTRLIKIVH